MYVSYVCIICIMYESGSIIYMYIPCDIHVHVYIRSIIYDTAGVPCILSDLQLKNARNFFFLSV